MRTRMSLLSKVPVPRWMARLYVWLFKRVPVNGLCPACAHRKGEIQAVTDGTRVMVEHTCKVCRWVWQQPTALLIGPDQIVERLKAPPLDPREAALWAAGKDKATKANRGVDLSWHSEEKTV